MLQAISDRVKGWLGWAIVLLISIPFALWGIQQYLGGGAESYVVKVNDTEITSSDYDAALARQRARFQAMFGGSLPMDEAFESVLKKRVLDQLIVEELLYQQVAKSGYWVSDTQLAKQIHDIEEFQLDGNFDRELYERVLRSQGLSPAFFEQQYRQSLMVDQLRRGVMGTAFIPNEQLNRLHQLENQVRKVDYLKFGIERFMNEEAISDEAVQDYYQQHVENFMTPEQLSVSYVELTGDMLKSEVAVDEDNLRRKYDEYAQAQANVEQRKARHILVEAPEGISSEEESAKKQQIEDLLKRIEMGESFVELAKNESDDVGSASEGGDLGWVVRGTMVEPFEDALFSLEKGSISKPVRSQFGYHLIQLEDIKTAEVKTFEEMRASLDANVRNEQADKLFYERAELMANLAFENPETLEPLADALNGAIKETSLFTRVEGEGIATDSKVRQAAFSATVLNEGLNSEVIELGPRHAVVVRRSQRVAAKPRPVEEVKAEIIATIREEQAREMARNAAQAALSKLESGNTMEALTADNQADLVQLGEVTRKDTQVDSRIVRTAFGLARPADSAASYGVSEIAQGYAVVRVSAVTEAATSLDEGSLSSLRAQVEASEANQEFLGLVEFLRSQADIRFAKEVL